MATSYNPLPTSYNAFNRITIPVGDYRIKVVAKSPSRASLRFITGDFTEVSRNFLLKDYFDTYEMDFSIKNQQLFYIKDDANVGDIVIQDVKLVEKPLGKATINGLGEKPEEWENGSISSVGSPSASASNIRLIKRIPIESSTEYILTYDPAVITTTVVHYWDKNGAYISYLSLQTGTKFTSPPNAAWLNIRANFASGVGDPLYSATAKLMINLGSIPAPYEPKRGERMVLPVPVKNVFNLKTFNPVPMPEKTESETGYTLRAYQHYGPNPLTLKPNTTYTLSCRVNLLSGTATGAYGRIALYTGSTFFYLHSGSLLGDIKVTVTTPSDIEKYISMYIYGSSDAAAVIEIKDIQLEEGTTATPYENYRVQRSQKAVKIPKKNLFNKITVTTGYALDLANGNIAVNSPFSVSDFMEIKAGVSYNKTVSNGYCFYNGSKGFLSQGTGVSMTAPANAVYLRVTVPNTSIDSVQVEEGTVPTPFEPYKLQTQRANKTPRKNLIQGEKEQNNDLFRQGTGTSNWDNVWENGKLRISNGSSAVHGRGQRVTVEPGKTYTFSCLAEAASDGIVPRVMIGTTSLVGDIVAGHLPVSVAKVTFTATTSEIWIRFARNGANNSSAPAYCWNVQLETGDQQSTYEPFRLGLAPARKGLEFDKNGYVNIGKSLNIPLGGATQFTVDLILTPYEWNAGIWQWLFGNHNDSLATKGFYIGRDATNGLRFVVNGKNCGGTSATDPIRPGQRSRITAVFYGDKMELYHNGSLYAQTSFALAPLDNGPGTGSMDMGLNKAMYYASPIIPATYEYARLYTQALKPHEIGTDSPRLLDYTFTDPRTTANPAVAKAKAGPDGTIVGVTRQLNKQATR